ncbi:hypothetical protein I3843_15G085700 [Carya illinoinensis]|nr:hypothetical protein I3843_15G085700 [Carya illinoinensis]
MHMPSTADQASQAAHARDQTGPASPCARQARPCRQSASTPSKLLTSSDPATHHHHAGHTHLLRSTTRPPVQTACQPARSGDLTGTCHTQPTSLSSTQPAQHSPGQQAVQPSTHLQQ